MTDRKSILSKTIDGKLDGFEFKWSESRKPKIPKDWARHYGDASHTVIHRENYLDFVL